MARKASRDAWEALAWRIAGVVGLSLMGSGWASAQPTVITTLDAAGDVGLFSSVAYGPDGLALISYYDATNGDLKVAHCQDVACTAATPATIDSAGDVGRYTSLAIGADGLGIISYYDATQSALKVAHCSDAACSAASVVSVLSLSSMPSGTPDLAVGADGRPVIAFYSASGLRVARCSDAVCSSVTLSPALYGGARPSITIGGDGLPLLASTLTNLLVVTHCLDAGCTGSTWTAIYGYYNPDPPFSYLFFDTPSMTTGPDGRGVIVYTEQYHLYYTRFSTKIRRCSDVACTGLTSSMNVPVSSNFIDKSHDPVVAVRPGDLPLVVHRGEHIDNGARYLLASACTHPGCAASIRHTVDGPGAGTSHSVAISPAGRGLIAYYDGDNRNLKVAYLSDVPSTDLALGMTGPYGPVVPGQPYDYRYFVQNTGSDAANVRVTNRLPAEVAFLSASGGCSYQQPTHTATCSLASVPSATVSVFAGRVDVRALPTPPGTLANTAAVASSTPDTNPANNTATIQTTIGRWVGIAPVVVTEGNQGRTNARFRAVLHESSPPGSYPVSAAFTTSPGTAQSGTDYLPTSGALTFLAGSLEREVNIGVVGDLQPEDTETFSVSLSNPVGAGIGIPAATGTIVDDDVAVTGIETELLHGTSRTADLRSGAEPTPPTDFYRLAQAPFSSYHVIVDAASGDVVPLGVARLSGDGQTVLQAASASGTGASVTLNWVNDSALPSLNQLLRVRSGGCVTDCGTDDVYRVRAYETTARIARFDNTGSQTTFLVLQNPTDRPVGGTAWLWTAAGSLAASLPFSLAPHGTLVSSTATIAPGTSGSITVGHDAPYGALSGKAVGLDPTAGFGFDSPLESQPR